MKTANYEDAMALGRLLAMDANNVWMIIRGKQYLFASELIMAVLNDRSPAMRHTSAAA